MIYRTISYLILAFGLGAILFGDHGAATRSTSASLPIRNNDERVADKEAIRSHINKIFKAYLNRDCATIRATHAANWIGFTNDATSILKGLDNYIAHSAPYCLNNTSDPQGLSDYKLTELDYMFYGDVALVPYVADVTWGRDPGLKIRLRSLDVYAKSNGEWNQVGSNIGLHPESIQEQIQQAQQYRKLRPGELKNASNLREMVWRAYFSNDRAVLEKVIPAEVIAIDAGKNEFSNRDEVLAGAAEFARSGAKLLRLEFPKTEIQVYGNVAIFYTNYLYEIERGGEKTTQSGRATEIFVRQGDTFVNAGWHLDSGK